MNTSLKYCDLHTHSTWSDGVESPAKVVEHALDRKLSALALTDHDTLKGLAQARDRAAGSELEIISGVELSSARGDFEIHILGYFFDEENSELLEQLESFRSIRRERAVSMVNRLQKMGIHVEVEDVFRRARGNTVGRPHIAEAMLDSGHVSSLEDAFRRYLGNGGPAWVPKPAFTPEDAIGLVRRAGGVAVIAHPATIGRDDLIADLVKAGLVGLECIHPKHDRMTQDRYEKVALELGLVATGGSDCHGRRTSGSMIGYGNVPASVVDSLREAAQALRNRN